MQSPAPRILRTVLRAPGVPLSGALRGFMESRFGTAFGAVRLRTDCGAAASAAAIQASAYTADSHVAFGEGAFAPETAKGRKLIAHELAHVVQQNGHSAGPLIRRVPIDTADTSQQPFGPTTD